MLIAKSEGHYHFLKGIDPYSCGVIADPGWEIVHVTLEQALPWREGFDRVEAYLQEVGRDRQGVVRHGVALACAFYYGGVYRFQSGLLSGTQGMGSVCGGMNPIARTNVAPLFDPPGEPMLHAFSYTVPASVDTPQTLVIARGWRIARGDIIGARYCPQRGYQCRSDAGEGWLCGGCHGRASVRPGGIMGDDQCGGCVHGACSGRAGRGYFVQSHWFGTATRIPLALYPAASGRY